MFSVSGVERVRVTTVDICGKTALVGHAPLSLLARCSRSQTFDDLSGEGYQREHHEVHAKEVYRYYRNAQENPGTVVASPSLILSYQTNMILSLIHI